MEWIALLSKKHQKLPFEELVTVLETDSSEYEIVGRFGERGVIFESDSIDFSRLAFTREVCRVIKGPSKMLSELGDVVGYPGSFCVRASVSREEDRDEIEKRLGGLLDTESRNVDLETPENVFRVFSTEKGLYLGKRVFKNDGGSFEDRRSHLRPFSSPISLHPKLARCIVNLSGVGKGGKLLDPFCGTGGILIEAGMVGMEVYGCEIDGGMAEGCRENLEYFGIDDYLVFEGDAFNFMEGYDGSFDGVVTDLPYGKSSLKNMDSERMVERLLELSERICDGRVVFMLDRESVSGIEADFEIYVHRSLSRYVFIVDPKQLNIEEE